MVATIAISIPSAEPQPPGRSPDRSHTVFRVEVLSHGRRHTVLKRYSEFQALHKRIKKSCTVPTFPPRHVPHWLPKALEQRRQGLELYLRGVLYHNQELPQDVLEFLRVKRAQDAKVTLSSHQPSQRPVLGFSRDPFVLLPGMDLLPNMVLVGVLQGLYTPPEWGAQPAPGSRGSPDPTQHPGPGW